jgi:hypothetical protein
MPIVGPPTLEQLEYRVRSDPQSGLALRTPIVREEWLWLSQPHSAEDHPSVIIDGGKELQWHMYGTRHRDETLGPAWIKDYGRIKVYYNLGEIHRNNGPAMISDESQKWYLHGKLHRADGPAIIYADNRVCWFWLDKWFFSIDEWFEVSKINPELFTMLKLEFG